MVEFEPPLSKESGPPILVTTSVVDAFPVVVEMVQPAPLVEFVAPSPAATYAAPAPMAELVAPVPAVPVVECVDPTLAFTMFEMANRSPGEG